MKPTLPRIVERNELVAFAFDSLLTLSQSNSYDASKGVQCFMRPVLRRAWSTRKRMSNEDKMSLGKKSDSCDYITQYFRHFLQLSRSMRDVIMSPTVQQKRDLVRTVQYRAPYCNLTVPVRTPPDTTTTCGGHTFESC